jgi:hypothetical protein
MTVAATAIAEQQVLLLRMAKRRLSFNLPNMISILFRSL